MSNENKQNDERADLPRYTEWMHLREHGQWSDGVPHWARDHTGRMNDFTAANAVIEELAARATQQATKGDERAAFERHWYDFYHSGSIRARSDGRYMQPAVQAAWDAWQARATTPSPVAGSAGQAPKPVGFRTRLPGFEWVPWMTDDQEMIERMIRSAIKHGSEGEALYAESPTAPSLATDAGAVLSDLQRATIQAAADSAHRVLIAGGDGGDELSDAGLRRELKESRDMLRALLAAHPTEQRMSDAARDAKDAARWRRIECVLEEAQRNSDLSMGVEMEFDAVRAARKAEIERKGES